MQRRVLRILILLWMGWYLSGPLAEAVDYWDSPKAETADIARSAGGEVALIGAIACFVITQLRAFRALCSFVPRYFGQYLPSLVPERCATVLPGASGLIYCSPQLFLRI